MLTYLTVETSDRLLAWLVQQLPHIAIATYGQCIPGDAFGTVMCDNMLRRNSPIYLHQYPTVASQHALFVKLGYDSVDAVDLCEYWLRHCDVEQRAAAAQLEMFDEFEDW